MRLRKHQAGLHTTPDSGTGVCYQLVRRNVGRQLVQRRSDNDISNGLLDDSMDTMASSELTQEQAQLVARSEELVDRFLDAIWMERGLSQNTLGAYRADLMTLCRELAKGGKTIDKADKADLLDFIAGRVESGAKPRSTARQLSSFRRFFRYIMRGISISAVGSSLRMPSRMI